MRSFLAAALVGIALAGCGEDTGTDVPAACRDATPEEVLVALEAAPGEVRLSGTPLSECFNRNANPGDVQGLGAVLIEVAENLANEAREEPEGEAPTRLGYLLGAAERGAGHTQGIHSELIRRLENTSAGIDSSDPGYRQGLAAGRATG